MDQQVYSDLPAGATVLHDPGATTQYSDLPPGATILHAPTDTRNSIQKSFDENTKTSSSEPLLETGLKSVVGAIGAPFVHPIETAKTLGKSAVTMGLSGGYDTGKGIAADYKEGGLPYAATKAAGNLVGSVALGGGVEAEAGLTKMAAGGVADAAIAARAAAIGDTDAAAMRGLKVPPNSPKMQSLLQAKDTAAPYVKGVQSLDELQKAIPAAKSEVWGPYQEVVDAAGDHPVKGPDGKMTTIGDLEAERLQLSAINRGLKGKVPNPEAVELAKQKGLSQAQALQREADVKAALDPALQQYGINPQAIRQTFAGVAKIGELTSGKSTIIEKPQPYGLGKALQLNLKQPLQAPGQILSGARDIVAGRPILSGSPADIGIREGFANAGEKPNLGIPLKGSELWQQLGKAKLAAHIEQFAVENPQSAPINLTASELEAAAKTPAGRQLLIKASDLTPGSTPMSNLAAQIKKLGVKP